MDKETDKEEAGKDTEARWWMRKSFKRAVALYGTMVFVSTLTIFFFEHSTVLSALRTALVAAIAKTFAATWVTGFFE